MSILNVGLDHSCVSNRVEGTRPTNLCPVLSSDQSSFSFRTVLILSIHFSLRRYLQIPEQENMLQRPNTFFLGFQIRVLWLVHFSTNELTSFKFEFENHPLFLIQVIYQIWIDAKKCCSKLPFDKFQVNICRFIHYFVLVSSIFPFYFQFYFRLLENISNKSRTSDQIRTSGQVYPSTSVRVHVQYICPGCSFSKMDYAKLKIHSKNPKSQLKILKISKIF